jgi:hypothetical protein
MVSISLDALCKLFYANMVPKIFCARLIGAGRGHQAKKTAKIKGFLEWKNFRMDFASEHKTGTGQKNPY